MKEAGQAKEQRKGTTGLMCEGPESATAQCGPSRVGQGKESRAPQERPGHPPQEVTLTHDTFMQNSSSTYKVPGSLHLNRQTRAVSSRGVAYILTGSEGISNNEQVNKAGRARDKAPSHLLPG